MLDVSRSDLVAAVAGAGTMGRGIVQVLAQCGAHTLVYDAQPGAAAIAKDAIGQSLGKLAEKGRLKPAQVQATLGRIEVADSLQGFAPCHVVIEAIVEDLNEKRRIFSSLEDVVAALAKRFGHTPVRCKDTPGFIVNHAGRAFVPESLRVLAEGVADFATIDRILVDAAGFRLGPFGLMDLVGLDVAHAVMKSMYQQSYEEPKYRPSFLAEPRVAAGLLGRKTGRGWYAYSEDGAAEPLPEPAAPIGKPDSVWAVPELKELFPRIEKDPSQASVCFVAPLGKDATTTALELGLDPARTVAVDPLFGFAKRRTLMTTPVTRPEVLDAAHGLLAADGVPVSVIKDSPGFVAQRVVAHIVNVGCDIMQMRIASPEDLERAVMLGLGYPRGPLGLGDALGAQKILAVLEAMHSFFLEPRYRPSPWLKRRARLGVSLLTPE